MRPDLAESYARCEEITRTQARNFYYGLRLLPDGKRQALYAIYAFMRQADDISDEIPTAHDAQMALERLRATLGDAYNGRAASTPVMKAFQDAITRYQIPKLLFDELLEGMTMDITPRRYSTFEELYRYCYRVAGVVGLACIHVWGAEDWEHAQQMAVECGVAFQLTNILRDIREDAQRGRLYLPAEDLEKFEVSEEDILQQRMTPSVRRLVSFEADRARTRYEYSQPLQCLIARDSRATFLTMYGIYRGVLEQIMRRPEAVMERRVSLSTIAKVAVAMGALRDARRPAPASGSQGSR